MTKNSTLKSLALGAIGALVASGVSVLPANGAGLADTSFISLSPSTGTEYSVLASTGGSTFNMVANEASTLTTGNIKFLVSDPSGVVEPTSNTTATAVAEVVTVSSAITAGDTTKASFSAGVGTAGRITFTSQKSTPEPHALEVGSLVEFSSAITLLGLTTSATVSANVPLLVTAVGAGTFEVQAEASFAPGTAVDGLTVSATANVTVLRSPRTVTNTYVVDSGIASSSTNETLELTAVGDVTRDVTVTAWKDANNNGLIDSNEYVSPTRTVKFVKASEVTVETSLAVVPGDLNLTAKIKTTPVLNGQQTPADTVNAAFNRQDSAKTFYAPNGSGDTATWNDITKEWSVVVSLASGSSVVASTTSAAADTSSGLVGPTNEDKVSLSKTSGSAVITITTTNSHHVRVGDKLTLTTGVAEFNVQLAVASIPASNKITLNAATASGAIVAVSSASYDVTTYGSSGNQLTFVDRAFAGEYSAQATLKGVLAGTKTTVQAVSASSADVQFNTVGSASVQGSADGSAIIVKKGTLTVPVTLSVLDADEAAVTAGRPVSVSFTTAVSGVKVNDKTGAQTLTTDAAGNVSLTVTSPAGVVGLMTISATAENIASGTFQIEWVAQSYSMVDLAGTAAALGESATRSIVAGGNVAMDLSVMDQWFAPAPAGDYRVVVTGAGTTQGVKALVDGKASIVVTDNGFQDPMTTTLTLQKLTSGVWGAVAGKTTTLTTDINKATNAVVLAANGSSLYGTEADLSSPVAAKALVAADYRLTTATRPAYATKVVVSGKVQNAGTSVGVEGAEVTLTGPSSVLFSNGNVDKLSSITVVTAQDGTFSVDMYSTTAQKDTVITVASLGKSSTTKVTFTGNTTAGVGTSLVITAPETVAPASTLQIKAKLSDTFGNAVGSVPVRVTYTGPGIAFGALPTAVDALGELSFSVLLGGGDTGTITVVVSYDQNGDGDYVDAKDLNTTKTITVGAAAVAAPSADQKVNAGSFKGFVAVYAKGYKGQRLSAKIGNDWVIVNSLASDFVRVTDFTGAGVAITVKIYIDRVEVASIPLTTK